MSVKVERLESAWCEIGAHERPGPGYCIFGGRASVNVCAPCASDLARALREVTGDGRGPDNRPTPRFKVGDRVRIVRGDCAGRDATVLGANIYAMQHGSSIEVRVGPINDSPNSWGWMPEWYVEPAAPPAVPERETPPPCSRCGGTRRITISRSAGGGRIGHWQGSAACPECAT